MFAKAAPVERKDSLVVLDLRRIGKVKLNEIMEHVLLQAREAKSITGYSRMHHRHSKTSSI